MLKAVAEHNKLLYTYSVTAVMERVLSQECRGAEEAGMRHINDMLNMGIGILAGWNYALRLQLH